MALFTQHGIDQAITSLNCQPATLRAKLLEQIRAAYGAVEDLDQITAIPATKLIEELWDVHTPEEIKQKRKNLSGLKSSVNKALKGLIDTGGNPEGIIISKDNIFTVSEEKKNSLIEKLGSLGGEGSIVDILGAVQNLIKNTISTEQTTDIDSLIKQLDNTKALLASLSGKEDGEKTDQHPTPSSNLTDGSGTEELEGGEDKDDQSGSSENEGELEEPGADDDEDWDSIEVEDDFEELIDEEVIEVEDEEDESGSEEGGDELEESGLGDDEDWDSIEVEDDFEELVDEEIIEVEDEGDESGSGEDGGELEESGRGDDEDWDSIEVEDDFEELIDEEVIEVENAEDESGSGEDGGEPEESGRGDNEDWDSIEVEDDFEELVDEEIIEVEDEGDESGSGENGDELEESGRGDDEDWDSIEVEDDFEELVDEEIIEVEDEGDELADSGDGDEDWDSFEVEDDFEELDDEEVIEVEDEGDESGSEEGGDELEESGRSDNEDWDSIEVEDDFEELIDEEVIEVEDKGDESGSGETGDELEESGRGDDEDWDSFEAEEDFEELADEEIIEVEDEGEHKDSELSQSLDLSQYIEPKEALDLGDVLQESNDAYITQILERFMPKFIKIPAGSYPVGAPKRRSSDRAKTLVQVHSFFIGQYPITNDLFDFFVRETGYTTDAEKTGYGLVTNNRIHDRVNGDTGSQVIVINQGVSTIQVKGANWLHPDGPESSLEHKGNHPVVQVSQHDAKAFSAWAGKRLPTEDEWEIAARGKEGLVYPWGNEPQPLANITSSHTGTTSPVGQFGRLSLSPFGLLDLIGNVAEWTSSQYQGNPNLIITKGGSWASEKITSGDRSIEPKQSWSNCIGFRCCVGGSGR